jgi:CheY-like chemotaxis protein
VKSRGNKLHPGTLAQSSAMPSTPARILVVEDDANVAVVLEARLCSFGYRVCDTARSGAAAIRSALRHNPDLILMDIMLDGDMNGIEAAEKIGARIDVPVIFLTCLNNAAVMDRAIRANPFGYIVKPYDTQALRSSIEIALIKHRAAMERERLIEKLEAALLTVKRLSGLLPICAACKRIRDHGDWRQIEDYISTHSEADFSHSICPECARKLYPDVDLEPPSS